MKDVLVIKIGGNIIDDEAALTDFLQAFSKLPGKKLLVHGGGKLATEFANKLGIPQQLIEGRRITDVDTLKVVTMVYGYINKNIVAGLQSLGNDAAGFTGADADVIRGHKRVGTVIDYGFVGDIDHIKLYRITELLHSNIVPVFSSIIHDGNGQLLNSNADTIASEIAKALSEEFRVSLIYCFEKQGVLADPDDNGSVINKLDERQFEKLKSEGQVSSGMIPKLQNAVNACKAGVNRVLIGHAKNLEAMISGESGTAIQ